MNILVLDDDWLSIGKKIEANFIELGHEITPCYTSEEVYSFLKLSKEKKAPLPEMCFFDVRLVGDEQDGIEVAVNVIKVYKIPVVIYSSMAYDEEYGNKYAKKIQEKGFPRAFYVPRGEMEVLEKLRQLIEDVEDNYEHPEIPSVLNDEVFDIINLRLGFLTQKLDKNENKNRQYQFLSKNEILYLRGNSKDETTIFFEKNDEILNFTVKRNIGGNDPAKIGVGDKIKRIFKNIHPLKCTNGFYFVNLERILFYSEGERRLTLEHNQHIFLSPEGARAFKKLRLLIRPKND